MIALVVLIQALRFTILNICSRAKYSGFIARWKLEGGWYNISNKPVACFNGSCQPSLEHHHQRGRFLYVFAPVLRKITGTLNQKSGLRVDGQTLFVGVPNTRFAHVYTGNVSQNLPHFFFHLLPAPALPGLFHVLPWSVTSLNVH